MKRLTDREKDVAELLAQGMVNREVGEELGITERTVKEHRSSIYKKLGIKSLAELIHIVNESHVAVPNWTWESDATGGSSFISDELLEFLGRTKDGMNGEGWLDVYHPLSREGAASHWQEAFQNKSAYAYPGRVRLGNGDYIWTLSIGIPRFKDGEYIGHQGLLIRMDPYIKRWRQLIPD